MDGYGAYLPHGSGQDRAASKKGLLKEKLELEAVRTKEGAKRVTIKRIEDELTFDKGFYVFIRALQLLKSHNDGVILVGLAGPSGSGKTAFSERVSSFMPGVSIISMDNYNDASKLVENNFDDPRLTDYELLLQNLADLRAGKAAQVPVYSFKTSSRVGYNEVPVPASRIVVIEGIYALSERLRPCLDLRVSIAGGVHFDLIKRVLRDITRSGQGPEEIIQQITDTVYPMYKAFIEPDLQAAQLKIHNSFNPFTGFGNATYILKARRPPGLDQQRVVEALGGPCECVHDSEMVDIHLLPPSEDPETCQSWLRLRNRDGRYTLMFEEWVTEGAFIISPRITFEVSVRVLGGLMSLGYTIGTIMRRTSTSFQASKDGAVVKLDVVQGLGEFVQVQGKSRGAVQPVARALGLAEFIPHSYIEQVQLGQLTDEFQAVTHDVAQRFSVNGESLLPTQDAVLFGASPPGSGGPSGGIQRARSGPLPTLLSTSAPISSSMPNAIGSSSSSSSRAGPARPCAAEGAAAAAAAAAAGANGAAGTPSPPPAATGSARLASPGLLSQALRQPSPAPGAARAADGAFGGASSKAGPGDSVAEAKDGSAQHAKDQQAAPCAALPRVCSRDELSGGAARAPPAGPGAGGSSGNGSGAAGVPPQVLKQLEALGEAARRSGGLQLQMEAMSHQYRLINEQLAELAAATQALTKQVQQQQQQQREQGQATPPHASRLQTAAAAACAVVVVAAAAVCVSAAVMRSR